MAGVYMTLNELHFMLSTVETLIRLAPDVLAVTGHSKKMMKGRKKGKGKAKGKRKAQTGSKSAPKLVKVSTPILNTVCFQCNAKSYYNISTK
jgi:hypothetical protein